MEHICDILNVLYDPHVDNVTRQKADDYLKGWKSGVSAWEVSISLLNSNSQEFVLFGSQVLRDKIINDIRQIEGKFYIELLNIITDKLIKGHNSSHPVTIQLSLCIINLLMNIDSSMIPDDLIMNICKSLPSSSPHILITFMSLIPEEISMYYNDAEYEKKIHIILYNNMEFIVDTIGTFMSVDDDEVIALVFKCLYYWIKYYKGVEYKHMSKYDFTSFAFSHIDIDYSIDFLARLSKKALLERWPNSRNIFTKGLSRSLCYLKEALFDGDRDRIASLAFLFTSIIEIYVLDFLKEYDENIDVRNIFEGLLMIVDSKDEESVSSVLEILFLISKSTSNGSVKLTQGMSDYILNLFCSLTKLLVFPEESSEWDKKKINVFREGRHYIGDGLKSCSYIIGSSKIAFCLHQQFISIDKNLNNNWRRLEAIFTTFRLISIVMSDEESKFISDIFLSLPDVCSSYNNELLQVSIVLFVSSYSFWISRNDCFVNSSFDLIINGIGTSKHIGDSSVLALSNLCLHCGKYLVKYSKEVESLYCKYENSHLSYDIISSLVFLYNSAEKNEKEKKTTFIFESLIDKIQGEDEQENLVALFQKCCIVLNTSENPNFLSIILEKILAVIKNTYDKDTNSLLTLGLLKNFIKSLMENLGENFIPELPKLMDIVLCELDRKRNEFVFSICSAIVREFGSLEVTCTLVSEFVRKVHFCVLCTDIQEYDTMESYMRFVTICFDFVPETLLDIYAIGALLRFITGFICSRDKYEPDVLISVFINLNTICGIQKDDSLDSNFRLEIRDLLLRSDGLKSIFLFLSEFVFNGIFGAFSSKTLGFASDFLMCLNDIDGQLLGTHFMRFVDTLHNNYVQDHEKKTIKEEYGSHIGNSSDFGEFIYRLSRTGRRWRKCMAK